MRLIDADAFIQMMEEKCDPESTLDPWVLSVCRGGVKMMSTVDAVPVVHGRWQWISSTYDRIPCEKRYWCSKCHHKTITHDSEPWEKFCPNCGAKMDGKDDDHHG